MRSARVLRHAAAGLVLGLLALELALRAVLFTDLPGTGFFAGRLRRAELYGEAGADPAFWALVARFRPPRDEAAAAHLDPLLGWRSPRAPTVGALPPGALDVGERRPVLVFGDAFAACGSGPFEECLGGRLARSDLAERLALVDCAVGGYGLDQMALSVAEVLPRWEVRDPIVVLALYVGQGLQRCHLSYRHAPKPRFVSLDGRLRLVRPADPAEPPSPRIASYLWRWYVHGSELPPWRLRKKLALDARARPVAELRALSSRILDALDARFADARIQWVVLLLPGLHDLARPDGAGWQERFLEDDLAHRPVVVVNARDDFELDQRRVQRRPARYFRARTGLYNTLGSEVAFRALERGLRELVGD